MIRVSFSIQEKKKKVSKLRTEKYFFEFYYNFPIKLQRYNCLGYDRKTGLRFEIEIDDKDLHEVINLIGNNYIINKSKGVCTFNHAFEKNGRTMDMVDIIEYINELEQTKSNAYNR